MYSRRIWRVAQCLISIWIIPRRQQQHVQLCARKNFTFEYFLLGFRHSLLMQCNNKKIKQRSYCPTFMLSSSAIYSPIRTIISKPISNSNFGHIVVIELSRCCCWIVWLTCPLGNGNNSSCSCRVTFFGWILLLVCATWPYRRRRRMNCLEFGRGSIYSHVKMPNEMR